MAQKTPEHVLIHAPYGRDSSMICQVLARAGVLASGCSTIEELCAGLSENVGAALLSDESLTPTGVAALTAVLNAQPPWSDLPLIITISGAGGMEASRRRFEFLEPLGNVSLLERPLRTLTLISTVRTALRARRRQYQLRENFADRERLVQELARSNGELAQFAHIVSHDLQAPLRMVRCYTEMLAKHYDGLVDSTAEGFISTIQDGASTMDVLIKTLLKYASLGQESITATEVDLSGVVNRVLAILQPTVVELRAEVSCDGLPTVYGDRVLLQDLIQNLVDNALKYHRPGMPPRISIAGTSAEGEWMISVRDNGAGIEPEYHEGIFAPLKRLHGKEISGTGIGLAMCRKIVERHGGKIWVESTPGSGSAFYFTLPIPNADQTRKPARAQSEESARAEERQRLASGGT
jgi:signal transduction histidine kinase